MEIRSNLAVLALAASLLSPAAALAAKGDCAQPASNGSAPLVSDCLFILKVAVGSRTCDPQCICAPKGTLPTSASDSLLCLRKSVGQQVTLSCPCSSGPTGDDFNDNKKDPARWGADVVFYGAGVMAEKHQRLEFTASSQTGRHYTSRPWVGSVLPFHADWEVQVDIANFTVLTQGDEADSYGISIFPEGDLTNEVFTELFASHDTGPSTGLGFYGAAYNSDDLVAEVLAFPIEDLTTGAARIAYDAGTRVLTIYYDVDPSNGYNWHELGSFGVDGSGGASGTTDWGMSSSDRFVVHLYGFTEELPVQSGKLYGDNFKVTGGVEP